MFAMSYVANGWARWEQNAYETAVLLLLVAPSSSSKLPVVIGNRCPNTSENPMEFRSTKFYSAYESATKQTRPTIVNT